MKLEFELEFEYYRTQSWSVLEFSAGAVRSECLIDQFTKKENIKIFTSDSILTFDHISKEYSNVQSVKLISIWVNNIMLNLNIIRPFTKFTYSNNEISHDSDSFELSQTGTWQFIFDQPFWNWYSNIRRNQNISKFSKEEIDLHFGSNDINSLNSLSRLKKLLNVQ